MSGPSRQKKKSQSNGCNACGRRLVTLRGNACCCPLASTRAWQVPRWPGQAGLEKGKVPRPAVAFGGAWEVQVLIPQHPRIRAVVESLLPSHLISSPQQGTASLQALVFHRLIRCLVCAVLSSPLLRVLGASSHHRKHPPWLSSFSLSCISPIAHLATKEQSQTAAPQAYSTAQHSTSFFSFATSSFHHILAHKHVSPSYKSMQASPALPLIDPSPELQSPSPKASSRPPIILFRAHIFNHRGFSSCLVSNKVPEKKNLTQANQPTKTESSLPGTIATLWSRASTVVSPSLL
ncbi:hypothetical protein J3F84DRAFT_235609 [Trichoderma pleuroticola]